MSDDADRLFRQAVAMSTEAVRHKVEAEKALEMADEALRRAVILGGGMNTPLSAVVDQNWHHDGKKQHE